MRRFCRVAGMVVLGLGTAGMIGLQPASARGYHGGHGGGWRGYDGHRYGYGYHGRPYGYGYRFPYAPGYRYFGFPHGPYPRYYGYYPYPYPYPYYPGSYVVVQ